MRSVYCIHFFFADGVSQLGNSRSVPTQFEKKERVGIQSMRANCSLKENMCDPMVEEEDEKIRIEQHVVVFTYPKHDTDYSQSTPRPTTTSTSTSVCDILAPPSRSEVITEASQESQQQQHQGVPRLPRRFKFSEKHIEISKQRGPNKYSHDSHFDSHVYPERSCRVASVWRLRQIIAVKKHLHEKEEQEQREAMHRQQAAAREDKEQQQQASSSSRCWIYICPQKRAKLGNVR